MWILGECRQICSMIGVLLKAGPRPSGPRPTAPGGPKAQRPGCLAARRPGGPVLIFRLFFHVTLTPNRPTVSYNGNRMSILMYTLYTHVYPVYPSIPCIPKCTLYTLYTLYTHVYPVHPCIPWPAVNPRTCTDLHRGWACKMDDGEFEFVYHAF